MKIFLIILAMIFNLNQHLNPHHLDLFQSTDLELVVRGGSNAGKTFSIADKLLTQQIWQQNVKEIKIVVIRKTFPSLRTTVLDTLEKRAELFKFGFNLNKSEWIARSGNLKFIFLSLNNKEDYHKLKSLTDVDYIWINEIPEIREDDYDECLRRLRGGQAKYSQLVCDFNPIGRHSWVHKRFYEQNFGNPHKLKYTIFDNHPSFLNTEKGRKSIEILRRMKNKDPNQYKIYFLGEWGDLKGVIFSWDIQPLPTEDWDWYDEIWYGLDFGYSVDPAAVVRIYRKALDFWLEETIYETDLTNQDLARRMHMKGVDPSAPIYCDSAEPKSIEEIRREGFNAKPASKGKDSVKAGIDYIKNLRIHIVDGSENISKEQKSYTWAKDKDGNNLNVPVDFNDHAMSGTRYGIWTHMKDRAPEVRVW